MNARAAIPATAGSAFCLATYVPQLAWAKPNAAYKANPVTTASVQAATQRRREQMVRVNDRMTRGVRYTHAVSVGAVHHG